MLLRRCAIATLICILPALTPPVTASAQSERAPAPSFAEPGISPDHGEIAFVSGGDVWSVPASGGTARILAAVGGTARRPLFSPDGRRIAFVATRPGANGIYLTTLADGATVRLTHDDVTPDLDGWSTDGRYIYFSSASHNIAYFRDLYRVEAGGGTPMPVVHEAYVNAMQGAPSPDGRTLAFVRNGFVEWWRRGHSHMDQSEITLFDLRTHTFEGVTNGDSKDRWPFWSPDGGTLYFVSDRSGSDQLWTRQGGKVRQLTQLHGDRVLFPSISRDGRLIAFERGMHIWTCDAASGATRELPIELRGTPDLPASTREVLTNRFSGLALSSDGRKIAFVARGRIFAASAADGGDAQGIDTNAAVADDLPVWSRDNRTIAYVIDRGREQAIATYTFPDGPERVVTPPGHHDDYPHWSVDGKAIAFVRDGSELHVFHLATHSDEVVARGIMDRRPFGDLGDIAFSPGGDWIAFVSQDREGFSNVRVVRTDGGQVHDVTYLPNLGGGPIAWSMDGTRLFVVTSQRTEPGEVAQVDLVPRAPRFKEDAFRKLFGPEPQPELPPHTLPAPPTTKPEPGASSSPSPARRTEIAFAGIRDRVTFLRTGLDVTRALTTPNGKTLLLVANDASEQNLYAFSVDETSDDAPVPKQLTNTPGSKRSPSVSADGHTAYYLDGGRVVALDLASKAARPIAVSATLDVDFARDKPLVFDQAWSTIDRWYADPSFHGADWSALYRRYEPYALGARSPAEFYRVLSLLIGELNSSHSGIAAPPAQAGGPLGRLGVDWDAAAYEREGRLRVARIVPLGPVALAHNISVGDDVVAVDGTPVDRRTDLDTLLAHASGKRVELRVAGAGAASRSVLVLPVDVSTEERLRYLDWVAGRRAYVERISGGRVGYVHLFDMGSDSLKRFYTDLDVANRSRQAVIVDVRNNTGGFVDPYAIDVLTRAEYIRFRSRFFTDPSERTSLGQRVLGKPTALVVNEHSLSDAENFTEAYRVLHAGPVVGEPTAGWIIFTSAASLADNSTLRVPSTRVIAHDGVDMELHPRPVDVRASNPPGAAERGDDPQLEAAVRALERRLRR